MIYLPSHNNLVTYIILLIIFYELGFSFGAIPFFALVYPGNLEGADKISIADLLTIFVLLYIAEVTALTY